MINIYDANTSNFDNNGLTSLNEAISCTSTQELNKTQTLELEYPIDKQGKFLHLKGLNIIKAGGQLYRIPLQSNIQANGNTVKVTANHIFYDLNNDFNDDVRADNKSVHDALVIAIAINPKFSVGTCSDLGLNTAYFVGESPTTSIYDKILARWGGELECDNFEVSIKDRIGTNTSILIAYGKNVQGFEQTLDWSQLATRIKLVGKDGARIDLVNSGSSYITSPRVSNYPFTITKEVKFENIEDATELKNAGLALWGIADLPNCNFKVTFADLAKTTEYKDFKSMLVLKMGDTVIIRHKIFNCDLSARVIKIVKNEITDKIESLELGQFKSNIANTFYTIDKQIQYVENSVVETKETVKELSTTVFQNDEEIRLQALAIDDVEGRVDSAELKITATAITNTVRSSTEYINDLGAKVTAEQSSIIAQTAANVKIGFNGIDDNIVMDSSGLAINNGALTVKNGDNVVIIDGLHNMHKILASGTIVMSLAEGERSKLMDVAHNLGYSPCNMAYMVNDNGDVSALPLTSYSTDTTMTGPLVVLGVTRCWVNSTRMQFYVLRPSGWTPATSFTIRYYLYKEVAI